ncbi:MAG: response regulator [Pirellulales bacterium]|nr:response regulator [Pirellulales bacterium]
MKFLIVDDDSACRALLEDILGELAHCEEAADGAEAVEQFREALDAGEPYDLICLDIMMPHVDGHQALDEMRKIEYERGIYGSSGVKVVMTTALSDSKHCIRAFHEGCESYVTKPINSQQLLEQVKMLLGKLSPLGNAVPRFGWNELPDDQPAGPGHFLLVDDDRACRELLRAMLKPYGECDMAYDGQEAVDAVRLALDDNRPYDLICLDIMMPGKSGHQALEEIRQIEAEHGIHGSDGVPVIMTTALNDSKHCIQSFKEGCESYITKPIQVNQLLGAMRQLGVLPAQTANSKSPTNSPK